MAVDIKRRNAFAQAFVQYPSVLAAFVENNATLTGGAPSLLEDEELNHRMMMILMAQFVIRLIKTRSTIEDILAKDHEVPENLALRWFAFETVARYVEYRKSLIAEADIEAPQEYINALSQIEQNMSDTIFETLEVEAKNNPDFEEIDFWRDIFMSFIQNQRREHPRWHYPIQAMVLGSHMETFRRALEGHAPPGAVLPERAVMVN
jgi:hypothetical protein